VRFVFQKFITYVFVEYTFHIRKLVESAPRDTNGVKLRIYVIDASVTFLIIVYLSLLEIANVSSLVIVYFAKRMQPGSIGSCRSKGLTIL